MPRLSTAARVTVVAGLISALLAGGFAYWIRHEVYTSRYEVERERANTTRDLIADNLAVELHRGNASTVTFPATTQLYEIIDSAGRTVKIHPALAPFQTNGRPIQPRPLPREAIAWDGDRAITFGAPDPKLQQHACTLESDRSICATVGRLSGRRLKAYRTVGLGFEFRRLDKEPGRLHGTLAITVFVLPFEAEDAVADVDRVLKPALPLAVLIIMLGAYVGTRTALRPVERMRAQAAAISQRNLHERVPVPRTGDVVARLATTLNETLARLEAAAEQQRGFVADAAHELRSPISSLRAILEVADEHPDRADWTKVSGTAIEETKRLQQLADDLLLVARLDAEPGTVHQPVDLAELVRRQLARRVDEGPELTFDAPESVLVAGDAAQLARLVRNLVDNAIRHARTSVAVGIEQQDGNVVLRIDDDGAGIPEAERERVFERFTRLDEARSRDAGGAGLGLAIAREIALRHHGTLTAAEAPDGGARFVLVLRQV
ncbi:HAMP domain-containing sensor histidine kinase [Kribbella sp. NPDC005582]|uniref:sensor histidine kinase n=1 Tax=Kribbella sp. NPDC005582 TaxID=3156893 RepID=UPI0033A9821F